MSDLPARVDVVVLGAGVVGASVAWHLGQAGGADVLLLERAKVGSGTSWHAAGNMETWRADPLIGAMVAYTVELFPELERQSGVQIGWRQDGRVHFTADPAIFERYRAVPARARARGVEVHLLDPREVGERLPVISTEGLVGGLWTPNDGRVDPTNLATAYERGAVRSGVRLVEDTPVTRIVAENGRVTGVETAGGRIRCDTVVLAGGLWSQALAQTCGVRLPLLALQHFYLLTEACGVPRDLPLFLSYDEYLYGREDVGGLLLGPFDRDAIPVEPHELPGTFAFALLDENWEQIAPNMPVLERRFPLLATTGIRTLVNGPESFTPDGNMLLGETPEVRGLHLACGMSSNGIALAAGTGRLVAERVLGRPPSWDATRLDIRRFAPFQASDAYRRARMPEIPAWFCDHDLTRSAVRGLRRSPLHARHLADGAVFEHVAGHERPIHFGDPAAELRAAREAVVRIDRSADAKLVVAGPNTATVLGRADLGPMAWILALDDRSHLLVADAETAVRLRAAVDGLVRADDRVVATDATAAFAILDLMGPNAATVVAAIAGSVAELASGRSERRTLALAEGHLARLAENAFRLVIPSDMAAHVDEALSCAGARHGLRPAGEVVAETLRVAAGRPRFGTDTTAFEEAGPRRLVRGTVPAAAIEPFEPVLRGGVTVGWITSAGLATDGRVAILARVEGPTDGLVTLAAGEPVPIEPLDG